MCHNGNLLFHGCIPMTDDGEFDGMKSTEMMYKGKEYMDYAGKVARRAFLGSTINPMLILCGICGVERNRHCQEEP